MDLKATLCPQAPRRLTFTALSYTLSTVDQARLAGCLGVKGGNGYTSVKQRTYRRWHWAWKAARKAGKWFTVKQDDYGRLHIVPMTQDERDRAHRQYKLDETVQLIFGESIKRQFEQGSIIYRRLG